MAILRELQMTPMQAQEMFSCLTWGEVRMVSFDLRQLEVLLKDDRRIRVFLEHSEDAYRILGELRRDARDYERGS